MTEATATAPDPSDTQLALWMARQLVADARARLVDVGADVDDPIQLADVFVDLPVFRGQRAALATLCLEEASDERPCHRWLLIGGAGSGKTTLSTMFAQVLRRPWVEPVISALPDREARVARRVCETIAARSPELQVDRAPRWFPIRIDLPSLARWIASAGEEATLADWLTLDVLRVVDAAQVVDESPGRAMMQRADLFWIFDGLDEVPATANREALVRMVRDALATTRGHAVVTTRPQSYAGEFDDLGALHLCPLEAEVASAYAERLVKAMLRGRDAVDARLDQLRNELGRPELADLLATPLHVAMAAHFVANDGQLPTSRWRLLDRYVSRIFERELRKHVDTGMRSDDEHILRVLHARAGLTLHMRAAVAEGARPLLRPRELRRLIEEKVRTDDTPEEDVQAVVERLLRFADERFGLLLRESAEGYGFAVRSLQEFFAAEALVESPSHAEARVRAVALDPHWLNVVTLIASRGMIAAKPHEQSEAIALTAGVCAAIDAGELGVAAGHTRLGTRLGLAMLRETEQSAWPGLHALLWEVVLRGIEGLPLFAGADWTGERVGARNGVVWSDALSVQLRAGRTLAALKGAAAERWRARAREVTTRLLDAGGELRRAGLELLAGLLDRDDAAALALLHSRAPWPVDDQKLLVERMLFESIGKVVPNAARKLVAQAPEVFTLGYLAGTVYWFQRSTAVDDALSIAQCLRGVRSDQIEFRVHDSGLTSSLTALPALGDSNWRRVETFAAAIPTPEWQAWAQVARFQQDPSPTTLATTIESISSVGDTNEFAWQLWRRTWPLSLCTRSIEAGVDPSVIITRLRNGELGDLDLWREAEKRWRENGEISVDQFIASHLPSSAPWRIEDGALQPSVGIASHGFRAGELATEHSLREQLLGLLANGNPFASQTLRSVAVFRSARSPWSEGIPLSFVDETRRVPQEDRFALLRCIEVIWPDLQGPDRSRWITALDAWGRRNEIYRFTSPERLGAEGHRRIVALASELIPLVEEHPGLLVAVLSLLHFAPTLDLSALTLPALGPDASPRLHATALTLRLLQDPPPELTADTLRVLRGTGDDAFGHIPTLASLLAQRDVAMSLPRTLALCEAALDDAARVEFLRALHALLRRAAKPAFATEEAWNNDYKLPGTFPGLQPPPPVPTRIVSIDVVTGLRLFKESPRFLASLPKPALGAGQWIVILGENGVGKTTLLRALALCLAPPGVGTRLLDDKLPMVRNGAAALRVTLDSGVFEARVERTGSPSTEQVVADDTRPRPWVVGYGVRRGNARGESDREPEPGVYGALHTLFERPGTLYNASSWLLDLRRRVLEEKDRAGTYGAREARGPEQRTWDAVVDALRRLLPDVLGIEATTDHVLVRHRRFDRGVRFDALSDGYLTTAGWVVDLIARWVERQRAAHEPVGDLLREMVGVVLLDELDMHLHPVWQMRIIDDVRALFPRLSFVVTTHNPLALHGARKGEIFVMRHGDGGVIELAQHDVMPGYDVDRVLLEQFGVEHTFDRETQKRLEQYRALRLAGVGEGDPKRRALEEELEVMLGPVFRRLRDKSMGPAEKPKKLTEAEAEEYRRKLQAGRSARGS